MDDTPKVLQNLQKDLSEAQRSGEAPREDVTYMLDMLHKSLDGAKLPARIIYMKNSHPHWIGRVYELRQIMFTLSESGHVKNKGPLVALIKRANTVISQRTQ